MDDDGAGSGLGYLASYQRGRLDGLWENQQQGLLSAFAARIQGRDTSGAGVLLAENQALRLANAQLWHRNQELEMLAERAQQDAHLYYAKIEEWIAYSNLVTAERDALRAEMASRAPDLT